MPAYLKANGVILIDYTRTLRNRIYIEGLNTALIQLNTCTATDARTFDTFDYRSTAASDALATYLQSLPSGTIITGVTIAGVANSLTTNARNALLEIGVDTTNLAGGIITFVATIGQPSLTRFRIRSDGSGIWLDMNAVVPCMYTHVMI